MISAIVSWILSFILKIFDYILGLFLSIISPDFSSGFANLVLNVSVHLQNFWGLCLRYFILVRSVFDISSFEMYLISELLIVTILRRPLILAIKLFVRWFRSIKL